MSPRKKRGKKSKKYKLKLIRRPRKGFVKQGAERSSEPRDISHISGDASQKGQSDRCHECTKSHRLNLGKLLNGWPLILTAEVANDKS